MHNPDGPEERTADADERAHQDEHDLDQDDLLDDLMIRLAVERMEMT